MTEKQCLYYKCIISPDLSYNDNPTQTFRCLLEIYVHGKIQPRKTL